MTTEQKAKCRQILSHYGIEKQRRQLVEECGELIQAIMKLERTDKERVHYIEELADVEIMMEQMKISLQTYDPLGWDIFTDMIEQKINRQLDRIAEEEAAKLQTTLYICDPEKNTECKKTSCKAYKHGECDLTTKRETAKLNDDGEPIIYSMMDYFKSQRQCTDQEIKRDFHTEEREKNESTH